jgi:hypothetical protein
MYYNGPEPCWCGCKSTLVFAIDGHERPVYRESLYFLCPSSGEPLGFSARGEWSSAQPEEGPVQVKVSRMRSQAHI